MSDAMHGGPQILPVPRTIPFCSLTAYLVDADNPATDGAGAYAYMQLMGMVALGWMWLKMAAASARLKDDPGEDRAFHETKVATARFYAQRELVGAEALRRKIEAGAESVMALPMEAF